MLEKLGYAWGFFWGVIAWVPLLLYCVLVAIALLDYEEFHWTLVQALDREI